MSPIRLDLFAEIVPNHGSWDPLRIGRVWKARPDEHRGRLVRIRLAVSRDLLTDDDLVADVEVPDLEPGEIVADLAVES